jgi:hypothetical protein
MASRTVDEFVAEVNRQTASGHLALKRWVDEISDANRAYFGALVGLETSMLGAAVDAEIGALQCAKGMLEANNQTSRAIAEQWIETSRQVQAATLRLVAAGGSIATEAMAPHG